MQRLGLHSPKTSLFQPRRSEIVVGVLVVVTMGLLLALGWRAGSRRAVTVDAEMRGHMLRQTKKIATALNPELARKLTFTAADKGTPAFEIFRRQLTALGKHIPNRGIYSMALRKGKIFFGPENYPEDDPMASPSGTEYQQPPTEDFQIFKDKHPVTIGPFTDEYGTFVSAFVPVLNPQNGEVLMVVGLDIEADNWQTQVNAARWSLSLITPITFLLAGVGSFIVWWYNRRRSAADLTLKKWVLIPTAVAMLAGMTALITYQYEQIRQESHRDTSQLLDQVGSEWNSDISSKVQMLRAQLDHIARNSAMAEAFQNHDRETLTALSLPIAGGLKKDYNITHFYFVDLDRTCFLRAHQPDRWGDQIDRFTMMAAQLTGEDTWGIELGPLGTFTLRCVRPWMKDGKIIGYLELGMEIGSLAKGLAENIGVDIVSVIHKERTSKEKFEAGKQAFGFTSQWDEYPDVVVSHQTLAVLPDELVHRFKTDYNTAFGNKEPFLLRQGDRIFGCGFIPLPDATGYDVADLIVLHDVTAKIGAASSDLFLNLGLALVFFMGVLTLLWSVTGRTEGQLGTAFKQVQES
jgi:hypothetical protein